MAVTRPMLGDLELQHVQKIEADQDQVLVRHDVPALEGDFLQRLDRRATQITLSGILTGPEVGDGLKALREKFRVAEPVSFVTDITTATTVDQVLIEEMGVREIAGRPARFEYAFTLREYMPAEEVITEEPPDDPDPPDDPADDIVENVGRLVVEVVVEGQPNFDVEQTQVTVQGTTQAGENLSRTLTDPEGNVWTEEEIPASQEAYTVTALVTGPPAMTGSAPAMIQAGQTTTVRITLSATSVVATILGIHFRFDNSFIEPCLRPVMAQVAQYAADHPQEKLLIVGHTDKTGPPTYNQSLSERRARSAYAYLTFGNSPAEADAAVAEWETLRQTRQVGQATSPNDTWGVREYQQMLQELELYPGQIDGDPGDRTREAVEAFRRQEGLPPGQTIDGPFWNALIRRYLAKASLRLNPDQLFPNCDDEKLKWLGCGEDDPIENINRAWRPNRRTEFIFVRTETIPCEIRIPDTFTLPAPGQGAAGNRWCLDRGGASARCCFVVPAKEDNPCPANVQNKWCRPARPQRFTINGSIRREVRLPAGTIRLDPAPQQKFIVTAPDGEYKKREQSSGEPFPDKTDGQGNFSLLNVPLGFFSIEVLEPPRSVLVRLADQTNDTARGNMVCREISSAQDRLEVVILAAPVRRQITLPVVAHLMTARDATGNRHQTTRDAAGVTQLFEGVNLIWQQARIRFELQETVQAIYEPPPPVTGQVSQAEFFFLLANCAFPNVINVFFVQDLAGSSVYFVVPPGGGAQTPGIALEDMSNDQQSVEFLAQALGNFLSLPLLTGGPTFDRLMHASATRSGTQIIEAEMETARASEGAQLEHTPLQLTVAGARQIGGRHSPVFIALHDTAAGPITVEAQIPADIVALGTVTMTGGDPVSGFPLRRNVNRTVAGSTPVEAIFTMPVTTSSGPVMRTFRHRVRIIIIDFSLIVQTNDDVRRLGASGSNIFVARQDLFLPPGRVMIEARLAPASAVPNCIPDDLIQWSGGDPFTEDIFSGQVPLSPFFRSVSRADIAQTTVSATVVGTTRSVIINVMSVGLVDNIDPFADSPLFPLNRVQIEGILNEDRTDFNLSDLSAAQTNSLFRVRADIPGVTGNTVRAKLFSRFADTTPVEPAIDVTLNRVGGDRFVSNLPILAIPFTIPRNEITFRSPDDIMVVRAQAGGNIRLEVDSGFAGLGIVETPVRGRVLEMCTITIVGANPPIAIDDHLAVANRVYAQCGIELRILRRDNVNNPTLLDINQTPCSLPGGRAPKPIETTLFALGRANCPVNFIIYFVRAIPGLAGCAFHPPGQPGATVDRDATRYTFAHEIGHVLGLRHSQDDPDVVDENNNLMHSPTSDISAEPRDTILKAIQCTKIEPSPLIRMVG